MHCKKKIKIKDSKGFPLQDPARLAKKSNLILSIYDPGYSDLFQLMYLIGF